MRIGIIGTGNVGKTLGSGLAAAGHEVRLGSREPARADLVSWSAASAIGVVPLPAAADHAEVAIIATSWSGTEAALAACEARRLAGKIVIDATNPLRFTSRLELALGHDDSGGEQVQRWLPGAHVVKAFNTVGWELMVRPALPGGPPTLFVAGDSAAAKATVTQLAQELGWTVADCGGLDSARLTEPLALLWIAHASATGNRAHALRWLGR